MKTILPDLKYYLNRLGNVSINALIQHIEKEDAEDYANLNNNIELLKKSMIGTYYKSQDENQYSLIHIKTIENDEDEIYIVCDELSVCNYQSISFTIDLCIELDDFYNNDYKESSQKEWIKELCYYFNRVPGNEEICCPTT